MYCGLVSSYSKKNGRGGVAPLQSESAQRPLSFIQCLRQVYIKHKMSRRNEPFNNYNERNHVPNQYN